MTRNTLRAALAGATLCAASLAAIPAAAASLLSSPVAVESPLPSFKFAEDLDGRYPAETTTTLSVPQFDPIFGTLSEVRLHLDATFDFELDYQLAGFFSWQYFGDVTLVGDGLRVEEIAFGSRRSPVVSGSFRAVDDRISVFDRDVETVTLGPAGWTGTGSRSIDVQVRQSATFQPSASTIFLRDNNASPDGFSPSEIVSTIAVEYVFEPGTQSLNTTVGLLTFSSAFRPEIVAQRNAAAIVPVPAALPLMAPRSPLSASPRAAAPDAAPGRAPEVRPNRLGLGAVFGGGASPINGLGWLGRESPVVTRPLHLEHCW